MSFSAHGTKKKYQSYYLLDGPFEKKINKTKISEEMCFWMILDWKKDTTKKKIGNNNLDTCHKSKFVWSLPFITLAASIHFTGNWNFIINWEVLIHTNISPLKIK